MNQISFLLITFTCFLSYTSAQDWPRFRGPGGNGSAAGSTAPVSWDDKTNLAWKTTLTGRGASSPVVVGDRIYLTAYSGYGINAEDFGDINKLRFHVLALDRNSGEIIWKSNDQAHPDTQKCSRRLLDHGYASSTPVADQNAVYAFFGQTGVLAYSREGQKLWQTNLGTKSAGFGSSSSPILFKDFVIVNASIESGTLFAIEKKTGKIAWKREGVNRTWTTPCLVQNQHGQPELIVNQIDQVRSFDPQNGSILWSCAGIPDYIVPIPVSHEGVIYCLGGRSNRSLAIELGGSGDVSATRKKWDRPIGANVTSPVFVNDRIYWASDKGIMNCVSAENGSEIFRNRLPTRKRIYASIVRAGKHLYVTTRDQGIIVLEIADQYKLVSQNRFDADPSLLNATPAISGKDIIIRSDRYLYCVRDLSQ